MERVLPIRWAEFLRFLLTLGTQIVFTMKRDSILGEHFENFRLIRTDNLYFLLITFFILKIIVDVIYADW